MPAPDILSITDIAAVEQQALLDSKSSCASILMAVELTSQVSATP